MPAFQTLDFTLVDDTDQTKAVKFDCSGVPTGNLKTLVVPGLFTSTDSLTLAITNIPQQHSAQHTFEDGLIAITESDTNPAIYAQRNSATIGTGLMIHFRTQAGVTMGGIGYRNGAWGNGPLCDSFDPTKRISLELGEITTGTSVTVTWPNVTGRLALDTSVVCYNGDVVTHDDDLVTI